MYASGYNAEGELANNTTTSTLAGYPNLVLGEDLNTLTSIEDIFSTGAVTFGGSTSVCAALKTDGTLYTWGYNAFGQTGVGNGTTDVKVATVVVALESIRGAASISNVAFGSCSNYQSMSVLLSDGRIYSCGYNAYGGLGVGISTVRLTYFKSYLPSTDVAEIKYANDGGSAAAHGSNLMVLMRDGSLWTSGYNGTYLVAISPPSYADTLTKVLFP
jgi:alpha-tubulin suppressor-like RCC1 family protein